MSEDKQTIEEPKTIEEVFKETGEKYKNDLKDIEELFNDTKLPESKFRVRVEEDLENSVAAHLLAAVNGDSNINEIARSSRVFYDYLLEYGFQPDQAMYLLHGYLAGGRL